MAIFLLPETFHEDCKKNNINNRLSLRMACNKNIVTLNPYSLGALHPPDQGAFPCCPPSHPRPQPSQVTFKRQSHEIALKRGGSIFVMPVMAISHRANSTWSTIPNIKTFCINVLYHSQVFCTFTT